MAISETKYQKITDPFLKEKNLGTLKYKNSRKNFLDETLSSQDVCNKKTENFSCNNFSSKNHKQIMQG
jgi:hypothetical protein